MVDDTYRGYRNDPNGRGGTGSSQPAADPLTELARLIGQSDPFGDHRRPDGRGSTDWRNDPAQSAYPDQNAAYADHYGTAAAGQPQYDQHAPYDQQPQYDQHGGHAAYDGAQQYGAQQYDAQQYDPQQYDAHQYGAHGADQYAANGADQVYANYAHHGAGYADPHGYGEAPYQQEAQPHYADPNGGAYDQSQQAANLGPPPYFDDPRAARPDGYYDEAPASRRRGWLITAAALVGLALLGTAGAFAYRSVVTGGPPPLITRDVRPDKVAPPSQNADNGSNKQPDRLAFGGNEQMAPPPEQPINVTVAPQPPAAAPTAPPMIAPGAAAEAAAPPLAPPAAPSASTEPSNPAAPRKIHTVTISTDQEPAGGAMVPARPTAPRAVPPHPAPRDANAPLSLAPQSVPDQPAAPPRNIAPGPPVRTTALAPAPAAPPREAAGGPGYYVQVSAQKSQEEARASFRSIQAKYASILHGHAPVFRRKDLGSKGVFYGAQVGPFSHEGAVHLCEQLKSAGGSCMIQRN
jgi:hypothetical protein